ncbi:MAG: glycosyltransferase family 39 protein [Zetaproteobacteria bacterium]|nr:MAG: glycosyltransferase family 39 protein [Zetaproteobacteria bacterium]
MMRYAPLLLTLWFVLGLLTIGLAPLFDYDETVYAQTALDMMRHGQWLVPEANGMRFFEKPPFVYYLMDIGFRLFGENAFAARLPSLIATLLTSLTLLWAGTKLFDRAFGWLAALIYLSLFEVGFLAHAAILDAVLNLFITVTLICYLLWRHEQRPAWLRMAALSAGIAVSIKGPVGIVIPALVILAERIWDRRAWRTTHAIPWLSSLLLFLLAATPWYVMIAIANGPEFLYEFIWVHNIGRAMHQMQGHGGGWHYYFVVFALSVLPWLAWQPRMFRHAIRYARSASPPETLLARMCLPWIALVIALFTCVQTKLPHYISCIYPAVALLLALLVRKSQHTGNARLPLATACILAPFSLFLLTMPWLYPKLAHWVHHPRARAILTQPIQPDISLPLAGLALACVLFWLIKARRPETAWRMIIVGMMLQLLLLVSAGTFAARLIQGPLLNIADQVRRAPLETPLYSLHLNAPSVSFYAGRNYRIIDAKRLEALLAEQRPFLLMLRSEARNELPPALQHQRPLLTQGGYLLYQVQP